MNILPGLLNQTLVYWPPAARNEFGKATYGTPVQLSCHWEQEQVEIKDAEGNNFISTATIFLDQEVLRGGWVWEGLLADAPANPITPVPLQQIKQCRRVPDVDNTETVYIANI